MRVPRFFARGEDRTVLENLLQSSIGEDSQIVLCEPELLKQMRNVLRLGSGSKIVMLDNKGSIFQLELVRLEKSQAICKVSAVLKADSSKAPPVELALALIKPERFEWCIEKLCELGVSRVQPVICTRSVIKWQSDSAVQKLKRWEAIAREACEQCERATIPDIVTPVPVNQFLKANASHREQPAKATSASGLDDNAGDLFFICAERQEVAPLVKALSGKIYKADTLAIKSIDSITLLVGPEGGFSEEELHAAIDSGGLPVSLGNRILRSETAAIAAMCQIASILDI